MRSFLFLLFAILFLISVALVSVSNAILTVHLVCHSHDDVGWQVTVDEYYNSEVRSIINTVVDGLNENPKRKFIYVEQAYFQRWWREQPDARRQLAQKLVSNGQLEFVNGGWCMHDEAGTHYVDMIDQQTVGHRYLTQQFGVQPTTTWQIDPFGHSATQATLFGPLSGIDAVFFARIDYQDKAIRQVNKTLETVWRSSRSLGAKAQSFAGAFAPGFGYGPPANMCWDIHACRGQPQIQNDKSKPGYNLDTFVDDFVTDALRQASMTNGNNLMWTLGSDFEWQTADSWYVNLDKLIDGVNADGRVQTLYSTPSIYLKAKYDEGLKWPLKTDDYFPYADGPDNFWTGYFTSRPALKRYVRFTSGYLQVVRQFEVFTSATGADSQNLWEAQGVAQHHDGVSGTAKQAVTYDYALQLSVGYDIADKFLGKTIGQLVTISGNPPAFSSCPLSNVSICSVTQNSNNLVVIIYNPLARTRTELITIPYSTQSGNPRVYDSSGLLVVSQLTAVMPNIARVQGSAQYQIQFVATLAGLTYTTYFINATQLEKEEHNEFLKEKLLINPEASITNDYWTLNFNDQTGLLTSATDRDGNTISISQAFYYYNSYQGNGQKSGAYIFRPDVSNATAVPLNSAKVTVISGTVVSEARQVFTPWLTQIVRLTAGSPIIEFEWTVGHIPVDDKQGKEIITRFTTNIASNATWYTDSNGREFQTRMRNYRPSWNWQPTEITSANYYPCNSGAWLADSKQGMAILNDRSQGCSSESDGALEFMIHRRLLMDDGRGVSEPLNEPGIDGLGLTITGFHYLILSTPDTVVANYRTHASRVFAAPYLAYAPLTGTVSNYISSHRVSQSYIRSPLPPNVDLITLQVHDSSKNVVLLRLAHQFGIGDDQRLSVPVTVDLQSLFLMNIASVNELALTANQPLGSHIGYNWTLQAAEEDSDDHSFYVHDFSQPGASFNITLNPAEIRTFNVTIGSVSLVTSHKRRGKMFN